MENIKIIDQFQGFLDTPDIFPESGEFPVFEFPEINITDSLITDLENLDHPRNSVLGKRMESFFEVAIKHSERYELIGSNIQIIENKRTLGELDFLLFDRKTEIPLHVELVYKLYVYDDSFSEETERWIVPNRRDSFSEKLHKLKQKQFPLLYRSETKFFLEKQGLKAEDIEQQLCFKAQLFSPEVSTSEKQSLINSECFRGIWMNFEEYLNLEAEDSLFYSPKKKDWSSSPANNSEWFSKEDIIVKVQELFRKHKSPLIWKKSGSGYERFFIVWW